MGFKFLRQDGWFQTVGPVDIGQSTSTTTGTVLTKSTTADIALNNVSNYFDGPAVAQGTTGIWLAVGSVTVQDTAGSAQFQCKLWDGTTVIASCELQAASATGNVTAALSGFITNPAGNIRISAKDITSVNGVMKFNASGNSVDSTITVYRIG